MAAASEKQLAIEDQPERFDFAKAEERVLQLWRDIKAFETSVKLSEGLPEYTFFDGPPFATGLPHYGHILAGTIKDCVTRYAHQTGHHVVRRFGWDCHGLPIEYEIDQKLGVKSREDVLGMGIDKYNEACRSIVMRCAEQWETVVERVGRWIDFRNDYKTMDLTFMESVWWVFKQLFDRGLVYRGFKVMPYSTACTTPLSNFEAKQNYHDDTRDPEVYVAFQSVDDPSVCFVAWTTTPWTLPSNLALCVHPEYTYVLVEVPEKKKAYWMLESRVADLGKRFGFPKKPTVRAKKLGSELRGMRYQPLFDYFAHAERIDGFRVLCDTYVGKDTGTGIVHNAPGFGEDDFRVCTEAGVVPKGGEGLPCPVDDNGRFTEPVHDFVGRYVKDCDSSIIERLKASGSLLASGTIVHSYPFCWRSDTPLIQRAVPSWFVRVESIKAQLLASNAATNWVPETVKEGRFHNWLQEARDWAISRNRFWGTPIPLWVSSDMEEIVCVGSVDELERLSGRRLTDLHRQFVDDVTIPSSRGKGALRRISEVFDCWFESGSMPYAQIHYPFENKSFFEAGFPADFIAEGIDQTRGWFYTLTVLGTALFGKSPFKNLIVNGLVLAADGKKMSKRLKNYPDPIAVINETGADALRLYLISSPVVKAENLRFKLPEVREVVKTVLLPWYSAFRFCVQNYRSYQLRSKETFQVELKKISQNVLDRWILASADQLIQFVRAEMAAYRLYTVVPRLLGFIEELTNWYVRLNRPRIKGERGAAEAHDSLSTLFHVLFLLCKAMAPFTPFFSEYVYQCMKPVLPETERAGSVHYLRFPESRPELVDKALVQQVSFMQSVINAAHHVRYNSQVPIRIPLAQLVVAHESKEVLDSVQALETFVREEVNVKQVVFCNDDNRYAVLKAMPNNQVLGRRLGKLFSRAMSTAIGELSHESLRSYRASGTIEVEGQQLTAGDLMLTRQLRPDVAPLVGEVVAEHDLVVLLDPVVTTELHEEGVARDIAARVQRMRKLAGLVKEDPAEVFFEEVGGSGQGAAVVAKYAEVIAATIKTRLLPHTLMGPGSFILLETTETAMGAPLRLMLVRAAVRVAHDYRPPASASLAPADAERWSRNLQGWVACMSYPLACRKLALDGVLPVRLDGVDVGLVLDRDVFYSTSAWAQTRSVV